MIKIRSLIPALLFVLLTAGCTQNIASAPPAEPTVGEVNVSSDVSSVSEEAAAVSEDKIAVSEDTASGPEEAVAEKKDVVSLDSLPYNLERYENEAKAEHPVYEYFGDRQIPKNGRYIDISGINCRDKDLEAFIDTLTNVERIRMKDCGLSNDQYAALQDEHPEIRFIWNIRVKNWVIPTDTVAFSTLIGWPGNCPLYDYDAKYLKYCTDMVALDLGHCYITDFSFLEYMPEIKILILVENYTYPDSHRRLKDISAVRFCKKLRYFEFFANDVEDISVISELTELEDLNLCYNWTKMTDPIKNLPHLKRLWIYGTRIAPADLQELREIYPDVEIVTSGSGSVDQGWRSGERYEAMRDMVINNKIDPIYAVDATTYEETLMTARYPVPEKEEEKTEETKEESKEDNKEENKEENNAAEPAEETAADENTEENMEEEEQDEK